VDDIQNPYRNQHNFDLRFMFTLNKIYAWTLTEYQRVVMLDVDNLFLRAPDELFQCGQFCAVFINPCIFHTGLFVLQARFSNYFLALTLSLFVVSGACCGVHVSDQFVYIGVTVLRFAPFMVDDTICVQL